MNDTTVAEKKAMHTPGPWSIHPIGIAEGTAGDPPFRFRDIKIGAGDTIIAEVNLLASPDGGLHVGGYPHVTDDAEQDANANLIIAAPELLDACRAVIADGFLDRPSLNKCRAAIAKAEGTR